MKKLLVFFILLTCVSFGQTHPHWLNISNRPVVYVTDYGAVGDGVTNDTPALTLAAP